MMINEQYLKNLTVPTERVDVVLDTDAYNEIDDQFAIAYMLRCTDRINVKSICAAPFFNAKATSPEDGMLKSYDEILKLLSLSGNTQLNGCVYKGSTCYLPNEQTAIEWAAADYMARLADNYTPENPLYIVAIGAITNVASAIIKNPNMVQNTVVVWLGGHAHHWPNTAEFNMEQDVAAARVVFGCGVPLVQLPCCGVVTHFATTRYELEHWLKGKNALCDYLVENAVNEAESYAAGKPWTRVIWDVTAVAWLVNDGDRFMRDRLCARPIPQYDHHYSFEPNRHFIKYVYDINRDALFEDMFNKLTK